MRAIYHRFDGVFDWKRGWSIIIYILPWERGCLLGKRTLFNLVSMRGPPSCFFMGNLKSGPMAIRRRNSWISDQKWTEKMKEYAKQLARWLFLRSIRKKKTSLYLLKPCREIGQSFEEIQSGGKLVKMVETFWMNIKTITEFCFYMM